MFVLTSTHRFWWPVTVMSPDPILTGKLVKQEFELRFDAIPQDEAIKLQAELAALPPEEFLPRQNEQLVRAIKDWRDVTDDEGVAVPFSEEALRLAMQHSWFRIGAWNAYNEGLAGTEKKPPARLGN
jgi:hypothetical protein